MQAIDLWNGDDSSLLRDSRWLSGEKSLPLYSPSPAFILEGGRDIRPANYRPNQLWQTGFSAP
jgi:hypothetical protein